MRWIWFIINLAVIAALGTAYAAPYVDPRAFWPPAMAGLIFPVLVLLNLLFFINWLVLRRWVFAAVAGLALLPSLWVSNQYAGFHGAADQDEATVSTKPLRVMSWNVRVFNKNAPEGRFTGREDMLDLMHREQPDVICLQEFFTVPGSDDADHEKLVREASGLGYSRIWEALHDNKGRQWGLAIFSRYPILEKGEVDFPGGGILNGCQYADLDAPMGRVRVFNMHLQSIHLSAVTYDLEEAVAEMSEANSRRATMLKFRDAYQARADQATRVEDAVLDSPWPVVLCGDFNDPPQSFAYQRVSSSLQDAFTLAGKGLARTHATLPGVRIDYVMVDSSFAVQSYQTPPIQISDHFPVLVEVGERALPER